MPSFQDWKRGLHGRVKAVKKSSMLGTGGLSPLLRPLPWYGRDGMSRTRSASLQHGNRRTWAIHWLSKDKVLPESMSIPAASRTKPRVPNAAS